MLSQNMISTPALLATSGEDGAAGAGALTTAALAAAAVTAVGLPSSAFSVCESCWWGGLLIHSGQYCARFEFTSAAFCIAQFWLAGEVVTNWVAESQSANSLPPSSLWRTGRKEKRAFQRPGRGVTSAW
jgi:hypothetical protein